MHIPPDDTFNAERKTCYLLGRSLALGENCEVFVFLLFATLFDWYVVVREHIGWFFICYLIFFVYLLGSSLALGENCEVFVVCY